ATKIGAVNFVNTEEPNTPFSFFCWMFWNKKIELNSSKGEQLFRHELFHIEQKHSHDVLYMELLAAIGWINPFFHLIRKELKATHEFLADQFAIRENEKWQYAELLLMQVFQTHQPLVNPFFNTQIKRRIAMITNSTKPNYQYLRKLMVLPVTALVIFLFAFSYREKSKTVLKKNEPRLTVQQPVTDTGTKPCPDTLALLRSDTKKAGLRETVPLKLKQLEVLTERVPLKLKQQETLIEIVSLKLKQQEPLMELELVPLKLKQQEPLRESVPLKLKQQKPLMELELVPLKLKEQVVNDTGTIPDRSTFRLLSRVEQKS
ncbi:MAG TPA: M56 family metallopeptidase, partial [Chitinophagaceae bacterium]|nr:M56 family metallopeptidase [Chitinophagaceae bacterium]